MVYCKGEFTISEDDRFEEIGIIRMGLFGGGYNMRSCIHGGVCPSVFILGVLHGFHLDGRDPNGRALFRGA